MCLMLSGKFPPFGKQNVIKIVWQTIYQRWTSIHKVLCTCSVCIIVGRFWVWSSWMRLLFETAYKETCSQQNRLVNVSISCLLLWQLSSNGQKLIFWERFSKKQRNFEKELAINQLRYFCRTCCLVYETNATCFRNQKKKQDSN